MAGKNLLYVGAGILFLVGLCLLVYGLFSIVASTSPSGSPSWMSYGIGFSMAGVFFLVVGGVTVYAAARAGKTEVVQQVTMQVDLPGQTKIEEVKCRSCGGTLSAKDITVANGAPMVTCPYCHTVYQLTEEPKW